MADVAASGGYYMAMACNKIVAEELTLTGSIGVVTGKFNFKELFQRVRPRVQLPNPNPNLSPKPNPNPNP